MSEEKTNQEISVEVPKTPTTDIGIQSIQDTMDMFLGTADVTAVYGEPVLHGHEMIIPAAEVLCGMGFGVGYGSGGTEKEDKGEPTVPGGGGGGGGGRSFARPVAVIIAGPEGTRVDPVIDITKIVMAFFTALGFMASFAIRSRHAERKITD
jgi:uncharacterized spore protein YtfJ